VDKSERNWIMAKYRALCVICLLIVLASAASYAQSSITGYFDLICPRGDCSTSLSSAVTVASAGQVTFTLNDNGTIAASLIDYGPATVVGFGFNSSGSPFESGWTPGTPDYPFGWGDNFGYQFGGFGSYETFNVPLQESWTIGTPGEFTSISQALNGGSNSTVEFFLADNTGSYGSTPVPVTGTPEPGSFLLFGSGALGLLGAIRRKLAR
jgi:hypothetical protein